MPPKQLQCLQNDYYILHKYKGVETIHIPFVKKALLKAMLFLQTAISNNRQTPPNIETHIEATANPLKYLKLPYNNLFAPIIYVEEQPCFGN